MMNIKVYTTIVNWQELSVCLENVPTRLLQRIVTVKAITEIKLNQNILN